ncbi:tRNA dihydrouridine synthase DusB [Thioalkalivibrio sp. XN8]|uniref:tRNA dihydrouridine synthase DusB n=1 Tax=Thioalkalivibrio sp. XN8 TaxID=2712863 RepID=UPI0013EB9E18|nr:tRNA dihydrouridine synthase DusB [Thioalkalivibrio sp. XN8]NGP52708.1 tRNA dihydrouridine synthase DusB [Thioalkalivibrio sp. XN8]
MRIGPYEFAAPVVALAPMAGVTDRPFRALCRRLGASYAATEMVSADQRLWDTPKSRHRLDHAGEGDPVMVQIAGGEPAMMAAAARANVALGAQVIDINMGCPAKKVCNRAAGSALLRDERLVAEILAAVVAAVEPLGVPVTLKTRTGWSPEQRNLLRVARLAEDAGIAAIAVHGRTRACRYGGRAEYDSIRALKAAVRIPVIANGDISTPAEARAVLAATGADGVMIGRAAQGRPWVFREIRHLLQTGQPLEPPGVAEVRDIILGHLDALHRFYGEARGVRTARKHLGWYLAGRPGGESLRQRFVRVDSARAQLELVDRYFEEALDEGLAA